MIRKFLTLLVVLPLAVLLVSLSVANRGPVTLAWNPLDPAAGDFQVTVPLYLVLLAALALGVLAGGVGAWLKQSKWRRMARDNANEAMSLRAERDRLKGQLQVASAAPARPSSVPMLPPAA
jgi:uncharacterized membrane protein YciS (DUF1049 family)